MLNKNKNTSTDNKNLTEEKNTQVAIYKRLLMMNEPYLNTLIINDITTFIPEMHTRTHNKEQAAALKSLN